MKLSFSTLVAGLVMAIAAPPAAAQDPGVTDRELLLGYIGAPSGPFAPLGEPIQKGVLAYWEHVNRQGGIHGRAVKVAFRDSSGEPAKAVELAAELIETQRIFALFNTFGTRASLAVARRAEQSSIPQLFVASSSSLLSDPSVHRFTIGFEPPPEVEVMAFATRIRQQHPTGTIAVLLPDDAFGRSYESILSRYLGGPARLYIVRHPPGAPTKDSIEALLRNTAAAVIVGTAQSSAVRMILERRRQIGAAVPVYFSRTALSMSRVAGPVLDPSLLDGTITSTYLKKANDPGPDVAAWRAWMGQFSAAERRDDEPFAYAYAVSATLHHVLEAVGRDVRREPVLERATRLNGFAAPMLAEGILVRTDPVDYQPIRSVRLQRFAAGVWVVMDGVMSTGGGTCPDGVKRCSNGGCPPPACETAM